MKNRHKIIIFSNLVLAGLSVALMQNNAKADTTQSTATTQVQAANNNAAQVSENNTESTATAVQNDQAAQAQVQATTTAASTDDTAQTQASAVATDQPISSPVVHGVVTTGDKLSPLFDESGQQLTVSLKANSAWATDNKLSTQTGDTYYRVSTNAYVNGNDVTLDYGYGDDGVVRVKGWGAKTFNRNDTGFTESGQSNLGANTSWKYNRSDSINGTSYWQVGSNLWITSTDATTAPAYQNPDGWLQIQNTQIQPEGNVGYDLYNGVEGIKTYLVRQFFGLGNGHTIYDGSVINNVRALQSRVGLPVTGVTDLATWKAMGYSEDSWYGIDSYIAPLLTNENSSRADHVEAMITQAKKYMGQPWISGAASSPDYGVDCSGLVTQAMYASGIDPSPVGSIQHAQPGHEWNSRDLWADWRLPHISGAYRQRGDLVFFSDPSTGIIWHVGILLDRDTMIDSWPGRIGVSSIYYGRGNIAGYARVFY